jgi:hypothetical protein
MTEITLPIYEEAEEGGYIGYIACVPVLTLKARRWKKCVKTCSKRCR